MNNATKKIIAREFLFIVLVSLIGLVSFLGTFSYNNYNQKKRDEYSKEIKDKSWLVAELEKNYTLKIKNQRWLQNIVYKTEEIYFTPRTSGSGLRGYNSAVSEVSLFTENEYERIEKLALSDSIKFAWNNIWDKEKVNYLTLISFTPESLKSFILRNRINYNDSLSFAKSKTIRNKVQSIELDYNRMEHNYFYSDERNSFVLSALFIGFALFFGARYLFYAIRWSIITLK